MSKSNIKKRKDLKRRGYISLLLLLITISLFVTATYAWFTDSGFSKGNKVFSGNLYVDVIATEDELLERYNIENPTTPIEDIDSDGNIHNELKSLFEADPYNYKQYTRTYPDEENEGEFITDYYYIITGKEASTINLYNLEPGQVKEFTVSYLNKGDLALSAAGALKIDTEKVYDAELERDVVVEKSYTGLQTLNMQYGPAGVGGADVYHNLYAVNSSDEKTIDPLKILEGIDADGNDREYSKITSGFSGGYKEYTRRLNKLVDMQAKYKTIEEGDVLVKKYADESATVLSVFDHPDGEGLVDVGGHLEDVLEVFIGVDKEASDYDRNKIYKEKDNRYYFGTLTEFMSLLTNGPISSKDYDYSLYSDSINPDTNKYELIKANAESGGEGASIAAAVLDSLDVCETPEEKYMFTCKSSKKDLFADYDRYISNAGGHCLPIDTIVDSSLHLPSKDGVEVNVYENGEVIDTYMASEISECSFAVYLPENVDSRYQNASISLSVGVTASQADFEMDDTGYMIYDKRIDTSTVPLKVKKGDIISVPIYKDEGGTKVESGNFLKFRVLDLKGTEAKLLNIDLEKYQYYSSDIKGEDMVDIDGSNYAAKYSNSNLKQSLDALLENLYKSTLITKDALVSSSYDNYAYTISSNGISKLTNSLPKYTFVDANDEDHVISEEIKTETLENVLIRPLSIDDIFEYYKGSSSISQLQIALLLKDLESGNVISAGGNKNFWLLNSTKNNNNNKSPEIYCVSDIGNIFNNSSQNSDVHLASIITVDLSKFTDYSDPIKETYNNITVLLANENFDLSKEFVKSIDSLRINSNINNVFNIKYCFNGTLDDYRKVYTSQEGDNNDYIENNIAGKITETKNNTDLYIIELPYLDKNSKEKINQLVNDAIGTKGDVVKVIYIGNDEEASSDSYPNTCFAGTNVFDYSKPITDSIKQYMSDNSLNALNYFINNPNSSHLYETSLIQYFISNNQLPGDVVKTENIEDANVVIFTNEVDYNAYKTTYNADKTEDNYFDDKFDTIIVDPYLANLNTSVYDYLSFDTLNTIKKSLPELLKYFYPKAGEIIHYDSLYKNVAAYSCKNNKH